jgi:hypothetical protein
MKRPNVLADKSIALFIRRLTVCHCAVGSWRERGDESSVDQSGAFESRAVAPTSDAFSIDIGL